VLIVDDEELFLRSSARVLEEVGHKVLTARNGMEALEIFAREHKGIDLVLLDLMMPHMSGEETCRQIRRIDAGVKVLLVSGYRPAEAESIAQTGADGFLGKPFDVGALQRLADDVMAK
jgi:CheY-like chemotaxis protein